MKAHTFVVGSFQEEASKKKVYILASTYPRLSEDAAAPDGACEACWDDTGNAMEADGRDVDGMLCSECELDNQCALADALMDRMKEG